MNGEELTITVSPQSLQAEFILLTSLEVVSQQLTKSTRIWNVNLSPFNSTTLNQVARIIQPKYSK